jgi:hypothetical protein
VSEPRRWPADRVLRQVRAECGLPDGATAERAGALAGLGYRDNGLLRRLVIYPQPFAKGRLSWRVEACAEAVQSPQAALWTWYEPAPELVLPADQEPRRNFHGYAWPVTGGGLDPELIRDMTRFVRVMLWFLADTRDLGTLMLHRDGDGANWATRGDVRGHVVGAVAARVAGAVMLARATGQPELEDAARALVAPGDARGRDVRYWAAQFREWSPVDISDLEAIEDVPKYSPEEIRREFARYFSPDKPPNR